MSEEVLRDRNFYVLALHIYKKSRYATILSLLRCINTATTMGRNYYHSMIILNIFTSMIITIYDYTLCYRLGLGYKNATAPSAPVAPSLSLFQ